MRQETRSTQRTRWRGADEGCACFLLPHQNCTTYVQRAPRVKKRQFGLQVQSLTLRAGTSYILILPFLILFALTSNILTVFVSYFSTFFFSVACFLFIYDVPRDHISRLSLYKSAATEEYYQYHTDTLLRMYYLEFPNQQQFAGCRRTGWKLQPQRTIT